MIINIETSFKCNYEKIIYYVKLSKTLNYIAKPLVVFIPENQNGFPDVWENGKYLTEMKLFGIISLGNQYIVIEKFKENHPNEFVLRDNGKGSLINKWDHWIFIRKSEKENSVSYVDRIEIKAGLMTIFVAIFASVFYRWRQFRWKQLIANGFQQLN